MKIAICLYGLARGNKDTWDSLCKYLIEPFQADLYIHTWLPKDDLNFHIPQKNTSSDQLVKFYRFFSSLRLLRNLTLTRQSSYEEIIYDNSGDKIFYQNQCNMFDSISNCAFQVQLMPKKYDFVIFCRPDLLIKERLDVFNEDWDFYHGGIFNSEKNSYDFEDTFFIMKASYLSIVLDIVKFHRSKLFIQNSIKNPIIHVVNKFGLIISNNNFVYGRSYKIIRSYGFEGYMKRLKAIIHRYAA
jgi:hypothetical protein